MYDHKASNTRRPKKSIVIFLTAYLLLTSFAIAQSNSGELRLTVKDPAGLALESSVELVSDANQVHRTYRTDETGYLDAKTLPFGLYRLQVSREGFDTYSGVVEIRSATPAEVSIKLAVEILHTTVIVNAETLVDPHRIGTINRVGDDSLEYASVAGPGRSVIDLVSSQPGWVLEANSVLHPRGVEYQTQYVVDGVPLTDNRSPAFAPVIEANDIDSVSILTANIPAEYGRKLGGVIEVSTVRDVRPGLHAKIAASGGSFGTANGYAQAQYGWGKNTFGITAEGALTDRYLDPPVLENFANHATSSSFSAHYERDVTSHDRIGFIVRHAQTVFQVPNELVQETAGQRQDRGSFETLGIFSYQHLFSTNVVGDLRFMSRDNAGRLTSNELSTPVIANQERGFREGYVKADIAVHHGIHELKTGFDVDYGSIHEKFNYNITDPTQFDPGTLATFSFAGRGLDREQSAYAQDLVRLGRLTLSAGLRWDHYQLIVEKTAISPRTGIAWYWPRTDTVLHASYDRVFQTPAFENILLSSSPLVASLNPQVLRVPVQPSHGDFYEVGLTQGFLAKFKLDLNAYTRLFDVFADDDLLLNTGVTFPISWRKGKIYGTEAKLDIPHWGRFSGYLSYSYMVGYGYAPVTGGLFLGDAATTVLANTQRFPSTQDQRNTVSARFRYQLMSRLWSAFGGSYGSGLPTEFDGTRQDAIAQFGSRIVDRINFDRGRVRPSLALNASAGAELMKIDRLAMRLQADIQNMNNRINVIDFAGVFSGTAIAPPRSYALRLTAEF
jgi:hypothetical protein